MNRRRQGALAVLTVFMSCLFMAYLAVITTHHNGLALFTRHHESGHSDDNDSWSGSGTWAGSELYPTPTPVLNPTCQALEQLAATSGICTTSDQCTGLYCVTGVGSFDISVEPCHNPPAVHVVGRNASGGLIVNRTLTQSFQRNLLGIGTLNINIRQSPNEDSISISVTVVVLGAVPVTIIPETTIPLNRAQCPHTTQPTNTRTSTPLRIPSSTPRVSNTRASKTSALFQLSMTQSLQAVSSSRPPMGTFYTAATVTSTSSSIMVSPSKLPAGAGQSITIAVAVPVTVLLVSIGGVVLLVSIVMAIRRHKRSRREYHFQQMTFNTDNDDDDDDNDL